MSISRDFGVALKAYRIAANESIQDVADSIEIPMDSLQKMEDGVELPPEDLLELFVSHFSLRESEAMRLWELAGYNNDYTKEFNMNDDGKPKELNVQIPADMPILYTDMVHVSGNDYGLVVNFIQGIGASGKPTVVSRVGMSREHAESLLKVLEQGLKGKSQ